MTYCASLEESEWQTEGPGLGRPGTLAGFLPVVYLYFFLVINEVVSYKRFRGPPFHLLLLLVFLCR